MASRTFGNEELGFQNLGKEDRIISVEELIKSAYSFTLTIVVLIDSLQFIPIFMNDASLSAEAISITLNSCLNLWP
ncbi:MAG: hypothetical protein HOD92_14345 [Deltaproteobacteria bacterium]|jgi:hypothetical protein|nr:hypothetical protein [Deltaproteobacteria bacterium]MBT4525064.1 hypothetical protein [Deltaproteobacteria bacterium]